MNPKHRAHVRMQLWYWGRTFETLKRCALEYQWVVDRLNDCADTLRAARLDGMPHGSGVGDPTARAVVAMEDSRARLAEAAERIAQEERDVLAKKAIIDELVDGLPPLWARVLRLRYVDGHRWDYIACKLNYSESAVKGIEAQSIEKIGRFWTFDVV